MQKMIRGTAGLIVLLCLSLNARAGVVVQQESGEVGAKQKEKITLYLEPNKIRVETSGSGPGGSIMIFDGDKRVLWMIQPDQKEYTELTSAQVEEMSQQMSGAMKQMQEQMASMPPEQRAMMEQMMKQRMGAAAAAAPTITYQQKGGGQKVGPFTCTLYDELSNGQRTAEICAAPVDQVRLKESDFRTFEALAKFMEPLAKMAPKGSWSAPPVRQLHGFPVRTVQYEGLRPTHETTVTSVEQKTLEGSLFTVPAGLKKNDMMEPGRGRGPRR